MSFRKITPTIAILGDTVYDVDKLTPAERQWLFDALQAQDEQRGLVQNGSATMMRGAPKPGSHL